MRRSPKETDESASLVTRRGLVLAGLQLGFMGVLGLRMRQMQVEEADSYRLLAEENRINVRLIPPSRGIIFDRHGVPIAQNAQNYRIIIVREDAGDVEETIARLRRLIALDEDDLDRNLKEMYRRSPFVPVTLADRLHWEDIAEVAVNAPALPGITPDVGLSREYPLGADFAHIVGYVGPVSDYDLSKLVDPDPLLQIPKFQIGKIGVETKLEADLRGKAGTKRIEINAAGRVIRELSRDEFTPGNDIQLTVDHGLQNYAQSRLAGESAGAVVMDVETGDLLAMASAPSFDPDLFVRGISSTDYSALTQNIYRPLFNKTVQGTYPPGSTFKMMTGLAALKAGVIGPGEKVYCPGFMETRRAWARRSERSIDPVLRRLLLRSRAAHRDRPDVGPLSPIRVGRAPRPADIRGGRGPDPVDQVEGAGARRGLAAGRHDQRGHRAGLCTDIAAATCRDDRADRQRARGEATVDQIGGWRRGSAGRRTRTGCLDQPSEHDPARNA